jgi:uncharacterized protein YbjT (DUF2867 family)
MKIVVIGGTGLIGSKLVEKLREAGHEPLAASPATGVSTLSAEGLAEALQGAHVVVDVTNAPDGDDAAVMEFFQRAAGVEVTTVRYDGITHDFMMLNPLSATNATRAAVAQAIAVLRDALRSV